MPFSYRYLLLLYVYSSSIQDLSGRTQSFNQLGLYLSNSLALVLNIISLASDTGIDLLLISLLLSEPVEDTQFIQI